jgi:capsular exopolysaccharide synthesis family protein
MSMTVNFPERDQARAERIPTQAPVEYEQPTSELDFWWLFNTIRRRLKLLVGLVVLITVCTGVYVSTLTPVYRAETRLVIEGDRERIVDVQSVSQSLTPDYTTVQTEAEYIGSRSIAIRIIRRLNVTEMPEFNPYIPSLQDGRLRKIALLILPVEMVDSIGEWVTQTTESNTFLNWVLPEKPEEPVTPPSQETVFDTVTDIFLGNLSVEGGEYSRTITITFTSQDRKFAAEVANAVAEEYLSDQEERRREALERASSFLSSRVTGLRDAVIESERRLEAVRRETGVIDVGDSVSLRAQVSGLTSQLTTERTKVAEDEARLGQLLRLGTGAGGAAGVNAVDGTQVLSSLQIRASDIEQRIAELQATRRSQHPDLVEARGELAEVQRAIGVQVTGAAQNLRAQIAAGRARISEISKAMDTAQEQLREQTEAEVTLRSIESEVRANRDLYELVLNRLKETGVQEGNIQTAQARVISRAVVPRAPIWPRVKVATLASFLLGCVLSVLLAILMEMAIRGFKNARQLENMVGLPVICSVPRTDQLSEDDQTVFDMVQHRPGAPFVLAIRKLRTAMSLLFPGRSGAVIAVTSSVDGEGKSSISAALTAMSAQSGQRVLIIDGDMIRPSLHKTMKVPNDVGLAQVLDGELDIDSVIEFDPDTGIHYMLSGQANRNEQGSYGSEIFGEMIKRVRNAFDLVIVDTPPVGLTPDVLVLLPSVDGVIFVVHWERTPRDVVIRNVREVKEVGDNLLGTVLSMNDIEVQSREGEGDYYGYYALDGDDEGRPAGLRGPS